MLLRALLVLVLGVRLLAAPGWMPVVADEGMLTLRVCSGAGLAPETVRVAVPGLRGGTERDEGAADAGEGACAFAGLGLPLLPTTSAPLPPPPDAGAVGPVVRKRTPAAGAEAPRPPSTGPPIVR